MVQFSQDRSQRESRTAEGNLRSFEVATVWSFPSIFREWWKRSFRPFRPLPRSFEAEKGLLGSILLLPDKVLEECVQKQVSEKYFHDPSHAVVFIALMKMRDRNQLIDRVSLTQFLADRHLLRQVGGAAAVTGLFTYVPTASNASYYLEVLREKYLRREIISTCAEFGSRAYEEQRDVHNLLDEAEAKILTIGEDRFNARVPGMKKLAMEALDAVERLNQRHGGLTGISTGLAAFDRLTNGMHAGEMIVIASRPAMGKTALAMNIAEHVTVTLDKPVAIYSLQMSTHQLMRRLLCSLAKVDLKKIREGRVGRRDIRRLTKATQKIANSKMFIDDTPGMSLLELCSHARRLRDRHDIQLIVIDDLHLLRPPTKRSRENRQIEITEITSGLKSLARELQLTVIVLASLNRKPDYRADRMQGVPLLSDLRESSAIEKFADVVGLLWRKSDDTADDQKNVDSEDEAELIIAKHRNGPVGVVPLTFLKTITRFEDRAPAACGTGKPNTDFEKERSNI